MPKIRVLLADDHPAMLAKVRNELGEEFEIVAAVQNGDEVLEAVKTLDPDVLVTDISMPIMDGLQAASKLQGERSRTKVVFLTIQDDPDFFDAAFLAGASAYVTKSRLSKDLSHAIRQAVSGHTFASPR